VRPREANLFDRKARWRGLPRPPLFTEPGHNLTPQQMGVDSFQADRSPTHMYLPPAAGLWTHQKGASTTTGLSTLKDVLEQKQSPEIGLSDQEKSELTEY